MDLKFKVTCVWFSRGFLWYRRALLRMSTLSGHELLYFSLFQGPALLSKLRKAVVEAFASYKTKPIMEVDGP